MASLQARHSRSCGIITARGSNNLWTTFADAVTGCTCPRGPLYYAILEHERKRKPEKVGRNRKNAERALGKIRVQVDEGEYQPRKDVRFRAWADEWFASLKRPKDNTLRSYKPTLAYAKEAFGEKYVRQIGPTDIDRFLGLMAGISTSTQAKHLRVLGSCLRRAVQRGYAIRNPVEDMGDDEKPQADKKESAYFEDAELPRLFSELPEGLYRSLFLVALKTGLRQGELAGLVWGDIDFAGKTITVRRNYTARKLSTTKSRRVRYVEFADDIAEPLGEWWGECGSPEGDVLVFPGTGSDGYLSAPYLSRGVLYPAMTRAGIDRVGPTGEKRTFHSIRHTYARVALESGAEIFWLSRQMGHSSQQVTTERYGHWERKASKREASKIKFPNLTVVRTEMRTDESQLAHAGANGHGTHEDAESLIRAVS